MYHTAFGVLVNNLVSTLFRSCYGICLTVVLEACDADGVCVFLGFRYYQHADHTNTQML